MKGKMKKGKRWKAKRAMAAYVLAGFALCGCSQPEEMENSIVIWPEYNEIPYHFGVAEIGDVIKSEKIVCTYRQMEEQEVCFQLSGRLVGKVYVREKDSVEKGELLAELSAGNLDREIERLEYQIARNELLLGYAEENENIGISALWVNYLYHTGMTESDTENLDDRIEGLQQSYRFQREDVSDALELDRRELGELRKEQQAGRVYADMDGVIYRLKDGLEGSTSRQGETIMTIVDTSECLFETSSPELAGYFREGETVSMDISYSSAAGRYELIPWHMEEWGETQLFAICDESGGTGIEVGASAHMRCGSG